MSDRLTQIIEAQELKVLHYCNKLEELNAKMKFTHEHKFFHEFEHLKTQKEVLVEVLYDYKKAVSDLRDMVNAWND
jgi:inorganic pyrophosphatase